MAFNKSELMRIRRAVGHCLDGSDAQVWAERFMQTMAAGGADLGVVGDRKKDKALWRPVHGKPRVIEVNLSHPGPHEYSGRVFDRRWGHARGWVLVELVDSELHVDGKRFGIFEEGPRPRVVSGDWLESALQGRELLHPHIFMACAQACLIPVQWDQGTSENSWGERFHLKRRLILHWEQLPSGAVKVHYLDWSGKGWRVRLRTNLEGLSMNYRVVAQIA